VLNRIVLKRAPIAAFALLTMALPSEAQTARAAGQKPLLPALAQTAKQPAAGLGRAAYTSADVACTTGRKRLWTETGWMVRRVTSCR
jgi:invasion protein IalB